MCCAHQYYKSIQHISQLGSDRGIVLLIVPAIEMGEVGVSGSPGELNTAAAEYGNHVN